MDLVTRKGREAKSRSTNKVCCQASGVRLKASFAKKSCCMYVQEVLLLEVLSS